MNSADGRGKHVHDRIKVGKVGYAAAKEDDTDRKKEIIEATHEPEALFIGALGRAPPGGDEEAQRCDLRWRNDAFGGRFEVVLVKHHSFSTVTLRFVYTQISAAMSSARRTIASASSGPSRRARAAASA